MAPTALSIVLATPPAAAQQAEVPSGATAPPSTPPAALDEGSLRPGDADPAAPAPDAGPEGTAPDNPAPAAAPTSAPDAPSRATPPAAREAAPLQDQPTSRAPATRDARDDGAPDGELRAPAPDKATSLTQRPADAPRPRPEEARGYASRPRHEGVDAVLLVPRLLLAVPRYVLTAAFWPLKASLRVIDRYRVAQHVEDLLYNDARTMAVLPAVSFQTAFGFSYGVTALHNDLFKHGEDLKLKVRFGGLYQQAYQLSLESERLAGTRFWTDSRVRFEQNPGLRFRGIGGQPRGQSDPMAPLVGPRDIFVATRFRQQRLLGLLRGGYTLGSPGAAIKTGASVIFNRRTFGRKRATTSDPSIEAVYDTGQLEGFDRGFQLLELQGLVIADFRDAPGRTSKGVYFELFGGGVPRIFDHRFVHYGAELTAFINLYAGDRTLILRAALEAVHGQEGDIPFTELPRLGGPQRLRGYALDTFRDARAAMGTLEYHYPIHELVHGTLFVEVGQVGPGYQELVDDLRDWKVGYGGGIGIGDAEDLALRVELAYGDSFTVFVATDPIQAFVDRTKQL